MKPLRAFALLLLVAPLPAGAADSDLYKTAPGPFRVNEAKVRWHDATSDRDFPVKIYAPRDVVGPQPLVVVLHGLGGTREGLAYLGRHWASYGYVTVHPHHVGSDQNVWQDTRTDSRLIQPAFARGWACRYTRCSWSVSTSV